MISIFSDKSTIILRKMLKDPGNEWVVRSFSKENDPFYGVGHGRVQKILNELDKQGYVEREKRGANSRTVFTSPDTLIEDWCKEYKFEFNTIHSFYSPDGNILRKIKEYYNHKEDNYALTLHVAANLSTHYVKTEDIHLYISASNFDDKTLALRQSLDLKQLVRGGNIHIIRPYYKNSVFFNSQIVRGFRTVSKLQLYLDLYNYQPRGREHAQYLKKLLEEKSEKLD